MTPAIALTKDPESVHWQDSPVYESADDLKRAIEKHAASRGRDGSLVRLAAHFGCTVQELLDAQQEILKANQ